MELSNKGYSKVSNISRVEYDDEEVTLNHIK